LDGGSGAGKIAAIPSYFWSGATKRRLIPPLKDAAKTLHRRNPGTIIDDDIDDEMVITAGERGTRRNK
jgi:hypothetical protein